MKSRDSLRSWLGAGPMSGIEAEEVLARLRRGMFATDSAPPEVGRYRDLELVGHGGMGVVYRAWDRALRRPVALKLWRVEHTGDRRRMRREARLMARLSHPNVAQVLDFGLHRGEAYLVMEFVRGADIAAWLSATSPTQSQILDVFLAAGRGLAAAHATGIVHRDFKPSNVLVGDDGRIRVTDFGLATTPEHRSATLAPARGSGEETITATGARLGTPRYMAPEQDSGGLVDARADQWSFAASLWESLSGEHPCLDEHGQRVPVGQWATSSEHAIPSPVARALRRALQFEPEQRYPDLEELLANLEDRDQRRRTRRRRLVFAAVSLAAIGLVTSTASAGAVCDPGSALAPTWSRARKARLAEAFSSSELPFGPHAWGLAEASVDAWAARWSSTYEAACARSTRETDRVMICLRGELRQLDVLLDLLSSPDPELVLHSDAAVAALPEPLLCVESGPSKVASDAPSSDHRDRMAQVRAHANVGDYAQAARLAHAATQISRRDPIEAAEASLEFGANRLRGGEPGDALESLRQAYYVASAHQRPNIAARAATQLLRAATKMAEAEIGEGWSRHAGAWIGRMAPGTRHRTDATIALSITRAGAWRQRGDYERAQASLQEAWDACRRDTEHPEASGLFNSMGLLSIERGAYEQAVSEFARAIEIATPRWGPQHPRLGHAINNLGNAHYHLEQFDAARDAYERAYQIRVSTLGPDHEHTAVSMMNVGLVADAGGDYSAARHNVQRAIEIFTEALGASHPQTADALASLASILAHEGELEQSTRVSRRALDGYIAHFGDNHPRIALQRENLAITLADLGRFEDSLREHSMALEVAGRTLGSDHPTRAWILHGLAYVQRQRGDAAEARAADREALSIYEGVFGAMHPDIGPVLVSLAYDALADRRFGAAAALASRARALQPSSPTARGLAAFYLAQARVAGGDLAPVATLLDEADGELQQAGARGLRDLEELRQWRSDNRL